MSVRSRNIRDGSNFVNRRNRQKLEKLQTPLTLDWAGPAIRRSGQLTSEAERYRPPPWLTSARSQFSSENLLPDAAKTPGERPWFALAATKDRSDRSDRTDQTDLLSDRTDPTDLVPPLAVSPAEPEPYRIGATESRAGWSCCQSTFNNPSSTCRR